MTRFTREAETREEKRLPFVERLRRQRRGDNCFEAVTS
jgi:hypothetical protein